MELTEDAKKAKRKYYREYRRNWKRNLTPEQREKQREYKRAWDRANPDKVKAAQIRFWNKKAEEMKASGEL